MTNRIGIILLAFVILCTVMLFAINQTDAAPPQEQEPEWITAYDFAVIKIHAKARFRMYHASRMGRCGVAYQTLLRSARAWDLRTARTLYRNGVNQMKYCTK